MSPFYTLPTGTFLPTFYSSILHSFIHLFFCLFFHSPIRSFIYSVIPFFLFSFLPTYRSAYQPTYLLPTSPTYPCSLTSLPVHLRINVYIQQRTYERALLVGRRSCYNDLGFCMLQSMEPFQLQSTVPQVDQIVNEVANFLLTD